MSPLKDKYYTILGILYYYVFLVRSQFFSEDKIIKYQYNKLKKLLCESYINIPFYNQSFKESNFNPFKDFNTLDDIIKIPILDKKYARENSLNLINQKYLNNSISFKTSGSTGVPFEEFVHPDQWIVEQGVVWRHWKWGGYNFRDKLAMVRSYVPLNESILWKKSKISNFIYFSPFHLNDNNIELYLKEMIVENVVILRGYPSSISLIADYVLKVKCDIPKIKLILTASEVLTDVDRIKIEKAFNSKVFNHYGLAEQVVMMGDCEKHLGLHNYDEYGYLELHDTEIPNVKKVIGTNLHNLTMPLIRYDTGDLAEVLDFKCNCGRNSTIVKNIIGRNDSLIITPSGYKIPTINFYTMFENFLEINKWQIVQISLNQLHFNLSVDNISEEQLLNLENQIKSRLDSSINYKIILNKEFLRKTEGKLNAFISLIN